MRGRDIIAALHAGERIYGTCALSTSSAWPVAVRGAGADLVFIDTEHTPIDRTLLSWMCRTYQALGIAPIVRIPKPDPYWACMALDGGASGIIAPYIENAAQVRELRGAVKWRPLKGQRLASILAGEAEPEPELAAYLAERNADNIMVAMIESAHGIAALEEILAVPQLDAVLIGPHDLSLSLGIPEQYSHPRFDEAVRTIIRQCRAHHVGVGIHFSSGIEQEIAWARAGANLIMHSNDVSLFRNALAADLAAFHEALDEKRDAPEEDKTRI